MNTKREFRVGDPVVVKGSVDVSQPGVELLGQHLTIVTVSSIVTTSDGSEWHRWYNGGYNWELSKDVKEKAGVTSAYQVLLRIEHAEGI